MKKTKTNQMMKEVKTNRKNKKERPAIKNKVIITVQKVNNNTQIEVMIR
jgi:hypothetical protein